MAVEAAYYACPEEVQLVTEAAVVATEVNQLPDGRAGVYAGLASAAANDPVAYQTEGIYTVAKTTGMVFLPGDEVWWDHSANKAHYKKVNDRDFFLGSAYGDAASADAVIVCDPKTDIYNPNVIRSSVGCVFSKPVVCCQSHEAIEFFKQKGILTLATTPAATALYFNQNLQQPLAIVMGTEANGLSDVWLQNTDMKVKVPMLGIADSLNVSACLAAVVYEAVRQRMT